METVNSQQPAGRKQERVRVQKLRMSCDACSNTKTKCDQARPSCIRCQKTGLKCNYSVSRRKGKPPAASRDPVNCANDQASSQSKQSLKPTQDREQSLEQETHSIVPDAFHLDENTSIMDLCTPPYEIPMADDWQCFVPPAVDLTARDLSMTPSNIFDQDFLSMHTPSTVCSNPVRANSDIFNFDDDFAEAADLALPKTPSQAEHTIPPTQLPTPDVGPPSQRADCNKLASSTLESLNLYCQNCSASPEHKARITTFDQVLIVNKSAVENVHQLLSCPCSLTLQSTLTLSLIIDKILKLYQNTIRNNASTCHLSPSSETSPKDHNCDTPITIGAYKMDPKDEQMMRMHILSSELRKAAAVVERLIDRYNSLVGQQGEDNGVYTALTSLLRRTLRDIARDISSALRKSES